MNVIGKDYLTAIQCYEKVQGEVCAADPWRLGFHIMPPTGWLNDPNGLAYYKGKYYVYFQYSPFSPEGGMKCWGLYTSLDLISWNYEGVKLCPDETFDVHGIYSGSSLTDGDSMYLYYTGNVKKIGDYDYIHNGREANTVVVRTCDGIHYDQKKLIMTQEDYGTDLTCHVRDPKVWRQGDTYYMVLGARATEGVGEILLFTSQDPWNFKLKQVIKSQIPFGYMWECPDLFLIEDRWILCISPQGVEAKDYDFQNIYQSVYCLMEGEPGGEYNLGEFRELDHGFDYYAPQSFEAPDGRRIQMAWMGLPDLEGIYENPTIERGWQHAMTVPREITVRDGVLYQLPVRELQSLRKNQWENKIIGSCATRINGGFELYLDQMEPGQSFSLTLDQGLLMKFLEEEQLFELRFTSEIGAGRTLRKAELKTLYNIRILVDTSSVEIFINDGSTVFTTRYYPPSPQILTESKDQGESQVLPEHEFLPEHEVRIEVSTANVCFWNL